MRTSWHCNVGATVACAHGFVGAVLGRGGGDGGSDGGDGHGHGHGRSGDGDGDGGFISACAPGVRMAF